MRVEQKSYAQILIVRPDDFVFSSTYSQYENFCPFLCFAGYFARDFRVGLREPEAVQPDKDVILLLEDYWNLLQSEEKKAVLDHELGHIASGHLAAKVEIIKKGGKPSSAVNETEEKEADAYSANINGKKAMRNGLLKALETMVDGYKAKGFRLTVDMVLKQDPILRNRLQTLEDKQAE